ncbi:IS21 family transposase [Inquilinus sp. OTU3971]|uniref:IS21 family transposase n=1 Tax=Inquilinus sp. OTU3971 TaxID=3043855 RepID=UPI00406C1616
MPAEWTTSSPQQDVLRGEGMRTPDEVAAMLRLWSLGWGTKRIAAEFGCSRNTVKRYVAAGGWAAYRRPARSRALAGLEEWLAERFRRHRGNADVVRQDLAREHGLRVSLRTVERAVAPLRQALQAEARATVRFETPPGRQLQIDFGELRVPIGGEVGRVFLFVATLGYSRRCYVQAFRHERQAAWFDGLEGAFAHFAGLTQEVLVDNARALVEHHDAETREVRFNERFRAFAQYWGFKPRACAPYRARTKGKDERGVGYVKRNAIAGHSFASWAELEAHLAWWMREIADVREHGTTGEPPVERFRRDEAGALRPLDGRPPFRQVRDLVRRVQLDCSVEVDTNAYSVPWRLIGETVRVVVAGGRVSIQHGGGEVAAHPESAGRRQRLVEPAHFAGIMPARPGARPAASPPPTPPPTADLLRPLQEYEQLAGGAW